MFLSSTCRSPVPRLSSACGTSSPAMHTTLEFQIATRCLDGTATHDRACHPGLLLGSAEEAFLTATKGKQPCPETSSFIPFHPMP